MHSPLPDASALEAGIIEDEQPSRLSRVQENVRNLLRTSRFGQVQDSPLPSPTTNQPNLDHLQATPHDSPIRRGFNQSEVISSPTAETTASRSPATSPTQDEEISGVLFPPASYQHVVQQMAHQSTLFNTRAAVALNHPDLTDPSMAAYLRQKSATRQRRAWKRSKHSKRKVVARAGTSQCLLCVLAALLLAAVIATYLVLALSSTDITPTFHILFILGILLATIVFAHTVVRLFIYGGSSPSKRQVLILPASRSKPRHRRREHQHRHQREMPTLSDAVTDFIPATPIQVHMPADEVRPDSREAEPTATADPDVIVTPNDWNKDANSIPNPPPAYGRWRGSVRANPDFLHWQAVPSSTEVDIPELPSPTYEEAMGAQHTGPPSYVTRDSPARRREVQQPDVDVEAQAQAVEPEMVEVRGVGIAV